VRILAIDIGTGTQDILLYDSTVEPENCFKLVMPAPTRILAERLRRATEERRPVFLHGTLMGGGPISWAARDHLAAGLTVYATPQAARTIDDDLSQVRDLGVHLVESRSEAPEGAVEMALGDLDLHAMQTAVAAFGLEPWWDGLAVAVQDHGEAPPGVSDRTFRFEHIRRVLEAAEGEAPTDPASRPRRRRAADGPCALHAFAYLRDEIPAAMTRMRAVAACAPLDVPTLVMDTGPAAVLGALQDPVASRRKSLLVVNVGNMHTLANLIVEGQLVALFEHHTGRLTADRLGAYLESLVAGTLTHEEVHADSGHGCYRRKGPASHAAGRPLLVVTGPRRQLLAAGRGSGAFARGSPYFAVPHGDMMMAGCWGLVSAFAQKLPACSP
jgi:uncharacterized protein (DUF1786 family)